jgi:hypothetical protein
LYCQAGSAGDEPEKILQQKVIWSTMLLAMAIRWATSHRTSKAHAERFKGYIFAYLQTLRELRPDIDLRPIHHNALHLSDFLTEFGPMHGWWMFAFERLIGVLQKINTNFHFGMLEGLALFATYMITIGQLEETMLNTFCAAAELKVSLERPGCPQILQTCVPILRSCFPDLKEGTLMHDIQTLGTEMGSKPVNKQPVALPDEIRKVYARLTSSRESTFHEYPRYTIRGNDFAMKHATKHNSTIFYQPPDSTTLVPGVIRQIFSPVSNTDQVFLAIH